MDAWRKLGPTSNLNLKKGKEKRKSYFSPILDNYGSRRERVRGERKVLSSLYDLRRSGGRNPSSQDLKFIYSTRLRVGIDNTQFHRKFRVWRRKASKRNSTFSLRFTAIGDSVSIWPRLKVGVLIEGNAWTPKSRIFIEDSSRSSGRPWVSGLRDCKNFRLRSKR